LSSKGKIFNLNTTWPKLQTLFEHSLCYILSTFSASASKENIKTNQFELEGHSNKHI